jgi:hypothetical protein
MEGVMLLEMEILRGEILWAEACPMGNHEINSTPARTTNTALLIILSSLLQRR